MFDNALEMFVLAGRSLPHALSMMVPEPWTNDPLMSAEKRAFYEYHSLISEPWDGLGHRRRPQSRRLRTHTSLTNTNSSSSLKHAVATLSL